MSDASAPRRPPKGGLKNRIDWLREGLAETKTNLAALEVQLRQMKEGMTALIGELAFIEREATETTQSIIVKATRAAVEAVGGYAGVEAAKVAVPNPKQPLRPMHRGPKGQRAGYRVGPTVPLGSFDRELLAVAMTEQNISAGALAERVGCSHSAIHNLLKGRVDTPRMALVAALESALGLKEAELLRY